MTEETSPSPTTPAGSVESEEGYEVSDTRFGISISCKSNKLDVKQLEKICMRTYAYMVVHDSEPIKKSMKGLVGE